MASISTSAGGLRTIQFFSPVDGLRRPIRLGAVPKKVAEAVKTRVEAIVACMAANVPLDLDTAAWVGSLDGEMRAKLENVGLVGPRAGGNASSLTLGEWINSYIAKRGDVKHATLVTYGRAKKHLLDFFGAEKQLAEITPGHADDWAAHMRGLGLAEATVRKMCSIAKQFFNSARKHKLITDSPVAELRSNVRGNEERFFFVTPEMIAKVIDACPDHQWRLLVALSRWGGLRCPSEHLALTWSDIDWEHERIRVPSPKTERHAGGASRQIPLFPELRPFLAEAFERAEPGTEYVITRYRDAKQNLRTTFEKIIKRAGLEPWEKLWHNLRASRQIELTNAFPAHVVCKWIGNSQVVAQEHYLHTLDSHFDRAVSVSTTCSIQEVVQKAVQLPAETACNASQAAVGQNLTIHATSSVTTGCDYFTQVATAK